MNIAVSCISSNSDERQLFSSAQHLCDDIKTWHTFSSIEELFSDLEQAGKQERRLVVVGQHIAELAPLNLVDAIRNYARQTAIVVVLPSADQELINRSMLAGARATLLRNWTPQQLVSTIHRVAKMVENEPQTTNNHAPTLRTARPRNVLSVVSAKGGAGKSTLCALLAHRFAQAGLSVAVVDLDVQFGDMRYLFNISPRFTLNDMLQSLSSRSFNPSLFGTPFQDGIVIFSPDLAPEKAEQFFGKVAPLIDSIADKFEVVVVNTGSFWTLLQAELLEATTKVLCLTNQSIVSARATAMMIELCRKLDLAVEQFVFAVNKYQEYGLSANDMSGALKIPEVFSISDFGQEVALLLDAGNTRGAFEVVAKEEHLEPLVSLLAKDLGINLFGVGAVQATMKKRPWWRFL